MRKNKKISVNEFRKLIRKLIIESEDASSKFARNVYSASSLRTTIDTYSLYIEVNASDQIKSIAVLMYNVFREYIQNLIIDDTVPDETKLNIFEQNINNAFERIDRACENIIKLQNNYGIENSIKMKTTIKLVQELINSLINLNTVGDAAEIKKYLSQNYKEDSLLPSKAGNILKLYPMYNIGGTHPITSYVNYLKFVLDKTKIYLLNYANSLVN